MKRKYRTTRVQWSVVWRRENWAETTGEQTRSFVSEVWARKFLDRLNTPVDRYGAKLAPATWLLRRREVGPWESVENGRTS